MAGNAVTTPVGGSPVDAYLAEIARLLRGPRRKRARILTELRDDLQQAADDRIGSGVPPLRAEQQATTAFGQPRTVAAAFAGELAIAYARRAAATYIVTGPLVGIWWLLLLQPRPWWTGAAALLAAIPVLPAVGAVVATAAATLASTGTLIRWLPETQPRRALTATTVIVALTAAADVTIIATYTGSQPTWPPLAILAVSASLTRTACGIATMRHAAVLRIAAAGHRPRRHTVRDDARGM